MDVLPKDITSFVWGFVVGGLVLFFSGVLKKAGEDSWSAAKARLFPTEPEPIKVAREFNPNLHEQGTFSWVPEEKIFDAEAGAIRSSATRMAGQSASALFKIERNFS